jgi:hypothetical protein
MRSGGLIDAYDFEVDAVSAQLRGRLATHAGYRSIQVLPTVGPTLAAVFVAGIGEVDRFDARQAVLLGWADPAAPGVRHHGPVQVDHQAGSTLVRWPAIEAVQKLPASVGWLVINGPAWPTGRAPWSDPRPTPARSPLGLTPSDRGRSTPCLLPTRRAKGMTGGRAYGLPSRHRPGP